METHWYAEPWWWITIGFLLFFAILPLKWWKVDKLNKVIGQVIGLMIGMAVLGGVVWLAYVIFVNMHFPTIQFKRYEKPTAQGNSPAVGFEWIELNRALLTKEGWKPFTPRGAVPSPTVLCVGKEAAAEEQVVLFRLPNTTLNSTVVLELRDENGKLLSGAGLAVGLATDDGATQFYPWAKHSPDGYRFVLSSAAIPPQGGRLAFKATGVYNVYACLSL